MIEDIEKHFKKWYPKEGCGIIAIINNEKTWIPCDNIADNDEDFVIDPTEYLRIKKRYPIYAIVHSHPDKSCEPTETDIAYCKALRINYWIFSYPGMELYQLSYE